VLFEHEVMVCRETNVLVHDLLDRTGEPLPYSSDEEAAMVLAKEVAVQVPPMHEPNHTHYFDSLGVLPGGPPVGYLGYLEGQPDETSDSLLLQHGCLTLSEADTRALCICRSILLRKGAILPSSVLTCTEHAEA
jgi:hypothetical protein